MNVYEAMNEATFTKEYSDSGCDIHWVVTYRGQTARCDNNYGDALETVRELMEQG